MPIKYDPERYALKIEIKRLREALGEIEVITDEPFYNTEKARLQINRCIKQTLKENEQ